MGCQSQIYLRLDETLQYLEIKKCDLEHTKHPFSKITIDWMPENRLLNPEEKEEALEMLKLGVPVARVQAEMMKKTGKNIKPKDIYNLYPRLNERGSNTIGEVLKLLDSYGMQI